jgi:hypothetical protein
VAGVAGWGLSIAILEVVVLVLNVLYQIDVAPPSGAYDLIANAVLGFSVSLPQYVILRRVLGYQSGGARAWVPVTVLVLVVADFISLFWLRDAPSSVKTITALLYGMAFIGAQGLLLKDMLKLRSAPWLWLLTTGVFIAVVFVVPDPYRALERVNTLVAMFTDAAVFGGIYGATYGLCLVLMVRLAARSRAPEPAMGLGPGLSGLRPDSRD